MNLPIDSGFPAALAALCLVVVGGVLAGCGQGFSRDDAIEDFMAANPEVDRADAVCVVDHQIDRYDLDGLAAEIEADPDNDDFTEAQFRDMFACGVAGDVTEQLVEQLEASGVDRVAAPCVADALTVDLADGDIDVLLSGEITEEFMSKFATAMQTCGASGE